MHQSERSLSFLEDVFLDDRNPPEAEADPLSLSLSLSLSYLLVSVWGGALIDTLTLKMC